MTSLEAVSKIAAILIVGVTLFSMITIVYETRVNNKYSRRMNRIYSGLINIAIIVAGVWVIMIGVYAFVVIG